MTPVRTVWHGLLAAGAYLSVASAPTLAQSQQTTPPAQSSGNSVIYLNQAWSQEDREWYYHFSQGSAVLSYDLFLNMEAADSQDLFRSGLSSPRYGMVPEAANPDNPDGLPIGVSKTVVATAIKGWPAGELRWLDLCGVPRRATEVQGEGHSYRRRNFADFRLPGDCWRYRRSASSDADRSGKIRPSGGTTRSIDRGCEGQAAPAH